MRVIGIDPGTRAVGYGVVELCDGRLERLDGGAIRCAAEDLAQRLVGIHYALQTVLCEWQPDAAAIETAFFGENAATAIKIGEGRGVALLSAAEAGVPVVGYEPALVKRAVAGSGRAGKKQIQEMVRVLLHLDEAPATDHEADALALAICHLRRQGDETSRPGGAASVRRLPEAVEEALARQLLPAPRRSKGKGRGGIRIRRAP